MYKATHVDLAECCRQANGNAQEASQMKRLIVISLKNQIKGLSARVHEYEDRSTFMTSERHGLGCPCGIEFGCERIFVLKPPETLRRWGFRSEGDG
jgi:hypothetical protein